MSTYYVRPVLLRIIASYTVLLMTSLTGGPTLSPNVAGCIALPSDRPVRAVCIVIETLFVL